MCTTGSTDEGKECECECDCVRARRQRGVKIGAHWLTVNGARDERARVTGVARVACGGACVGGPFAAAGECLLPCALARRQCMPRRCRCTGAFREKPRSLASRHRSESNSITTCLVHACISTKGQQKMELEIATTAANNAPRRPCDAQRKQGPKNKPAEDYTRSVSQAQRRVRVVAQDVLLHFAADCHRELGNEPNVLRRLEVRQGGAAQVAQRLRSLV